MTRSGRSKKKDVTVLAPSADCSGTGEDGKGAAAKDGKGTKALKVYWDKDPSRTDCLIEYLKDNPEDRQKLFSDSSQDTKAESRKRRVAKGSKSAFYTKIANAVFSVDDDKSVREDFERDPGKYGKSVENCIST